MTDNEQLLLRFSNLIFVVTIIKRLIWFVQYYDYNQNQLIVLIEVELIHRMKRISKVDHVYFSFDSSNEIYENAFHFDKW